MQDVYKRQHYDPGAEHPYLHPGRKADILYDGAVVGFLGEVHPDVADNYKIGDRAYIAVIDMPSIMDFTTFDRKYTGIARFPAVTRDIDVYKRQDRDWAVTGKMVMIRSGKFKWTTVFLRLWRFRCRRT